jgi:hypothetical protein
MSTSRRGDTSRMTPAVTARSPGSITPAGFRLCHQGPDLLSVTRCSASAQIRMPQDRAPGNIRERDDGESNRCDGCHGRRHSDGDFPRIAQRSLLRHKFADHQGKVSYNGDD